jgi:hypothetical protein
MPDHSGQRLEREPAALMLRTCLFEDELFEMATSARGGYEKLKGEPGRPGARPAVEELLA